MCQSIPHQFRSRRPLPRTRGCQQEHHPHRPLRVEVEGVGRRAGMDGVVMGEEVDAEIPIRLHGLDQTPHSRLAVLRFNIVIRIEFPWCRFPLNARNAFRPGLASPFTQLTSSKCKAGHFNLAVLFQNSRRTISRFVLFISTLNASPSFSRYASYQLHDPIHVGRLLCSPGGVPTGPSFSASI